MLVKIYEPAGRTDDLLPAMLWIHGGGYVLGHPDMDDELCERFVQTAECVVVSVDYRLAPEHPYPAAIEDCYAGLVWMTEAAELLGIDVNRVARCDGPSTSSQRGPLLMNDHQVVSNTGENNRVGS